MEPLGIVAVVIAAVGLIIGYMEWRDKRTRSEKDDRSDAIKDRSEFAVRDHQIMKILPWFDEDRDHDTLPSMVKDLIEHQVEWRTGIAHIISRCDELAANQGVFGKRLDDHLVAEEGNQHSLDAKIDTLSGEVHELRARVEEQGR